MEKNSLDKIKEFFSNNKWIFVFLSAIPFFNDGYVGFSIVQDWLMDYIKIVVFLILFILLLKRNKKMSPLLIILIVMEIWWLISTLLNYPLSETVVFHKTVIDMVNAISVAMIVEYFKDDGLSLIDGLMLNLELAIYPNLVSVFTNLSERGYYLLGYYAVLILWLLPAICVALLYIINHKKYIRGSFLIVASIITAVLTWCATIIMSLLGMTVLFVFGLIWMNNKKTKDIQLPLSVFVLLSLLGNLFVLLVYNGGSFPLIDIFIEKFLGRSTNFTGRVPIWQEAFRMFKTSPIYGLGYRPEIEVNFVAIHAHNMLLQRLTATGIVGLVLFCLLHIELVRKVDKSNNTVSRLVMMSGVFAVTITYIMDAYKKFFRLYLVLFVAYHIDDIIRSKLINKDTLLK